MFICSKICFSLTCLSSLIPFKGTLGFLKGLQLKLCKQQIPSHPPLPTAMHKDLPTRAVAAPAYKVCSFLDLKKK